MQSPAALSVLKRRLSGAGRLLQAPIYSFRVPKLALKVRRWTVERISVSDRGTRNPRPKKDVERS
ncbi:unnamed protein product [Ixodes persulcatus]